MRATIYTTMYQKMYTFQFIKMYLIFKVFDVLRNNADRLVNFTVQAIPNKLLAFS